MVRINAVFPEDTLAEIDSIAKDERKSRSALLREAVDILIQEHRRRRAEDQRLQRARLAIEAQDRIREKSGAWNGVAEVRKWREDSK